MSLAFIGLGSNLNCPAKQVFNAITDLYESPLLKVKRVSSLYHSSPLDNKLQPSYVNAVVLIETDLLPLELLSLVNEIEKQYGRIRMSERFASRTLDLDILTYDNCVMQTETLIIPHPGVVNRNFVLFPMFEIDPDYVLPNNQSIRKLIAHCPSDDLVQFSEKEMQELMHVI
jgi:2-amino-4-hydroxy-6-hydroxymethyldihydropteridine diphosphokinase